MVRFRNISTVSVSLFFFFSILMLGIISSIPAYGYSQIDKTKTIKITESDRYFGNENLAYKDIFVGEVDPDNNFTYVKLTIKKLEGTPNLKVYINYMMAADEEETYFIPEDAPSNGTLNPYGLGRPIQVGDVFEFAFNWTTIHESYYPPHYLQVEIETMDDSDFTGTATIEFYYNLKGKEKSSDSSGFEWSLGFVAISTAVALTAFKRRRKTKN